MPTATPTCRRSARHSSGVGPWASSRRRRILAAILTIGVLSGLLIGAKIQAETWRNSISIWSRTLHHTTDNFVAHSNRGTLLFMKGETAVAIEQFERSIQINYGQAEVHNNLAVVYAEQGRYAEAVESAQRVLILAKGRLDPVVVEEIRERLKTVQVRFGK